jgi:hypothetical protein
MTWTRPVDLRHQTQKLWKNGTLLRVQMLDEALFPKRYPLKGPTSKELVERFDEVRKWIAVLQKQDDFRIEMREVRHRVIGTNAIPRYAWIDTLEQALRITGKIKQAGRFQSIVELCQRRNSALLEWIQKYPLKTLELGPVWPALLDVIDWCKAHPRSDIYLRQIDITGVHSKFIEQHRGTLINLLDLSLPVESISEGATGVGQFAQRYGFRAKPLRVRFRILDNGIRLLPGTDQDMTVTHDCFQSLYKEKLDLANIQRVFITENEINFLAFPAVRNSLVIFGAGYGFENLADIPWLRNLPVYYWGDIDTHGYAILNQLRAYLPQAQSLLMDRDTLLHHQSMWVNEPRQEQRQLTRLTSSEQLIYQDLTGNRYGEKVRLEQERVKFGWLLDVLESTVAMP